MGEIQAGRGGFFRPEDGDVGICSDLKHREAQADNKQGPKKHAIGGHVCRRPEESTPRRRDEESKHDAVFVSDLGDRVAFRGRDQEIQQRADEIGPEEGELHEHRLEVGEIKRLFEAWDQDVVEYRHEPPQEKEGGHDRECATSTLVVAGG